MIYFNTFYILIVNAIEIKRNMNQKCLMPFKCKCKMCDLIPPNREDDKPSLRDSLKLWVQSI